MIVGIFGAWRAEKGDPIYSRAFEYGRAIAKSGHAVLTGGYAGVMEAANFGAAEAGGRSIGVTCPEIDQLLPVNPWASELIAACDLPDRLAICFRMIDAAVFLPGRSGTMTELAFALEMREKKLLKYPVFLTCDFWNRFLAAYVEINAALPYPTSKSIDRSSYLCFGPTELLQKLEGQP
jgi:uncharacterized protein (TIGR00725 family)